jgi:hypothetical protein
MTRVNGSISNNGTVENANLDALRAILGGLKKYVEATLPSPK